MKKYILFLFTVFFTVNISFAAVDDNQIINELSGSNTEELGVDFRLKSFNSCEDMETVMGDYIKSYWKNQKNYRNLNYMIDDAVFEEAMDFDSVDSNLAGASVNVTSEKSVSSDGESGGGDDYSKTNTQVNGVDEADIVKTDGENVYYYNSLQKAVYIIKDTEVVKKINLPKTFNSSELYIADNRLVIISTGYSSVDYAKRGYFINRNTKTYTIVFDTTNISSPKLLKLYVNDGNYTRSRKIGNYLYVISNNQFNIPYYSYKNEEDIDISALKIIPKKIDISKETDSDKQNLTINGKKLPYSVKAGAVSKCEDIEYILPDDDTITKYSFNPSYNVISIIDMEDPTKSVKTKIIAGSNSEIHMSLDNLYLTDRMYQTYDFSCPAFARCMMPFYRRGENTVVHKLNIDDDTIRYQDSTIVPGNPLTQYSMDEHDSYFRIITKSWYPERETGLYILDKDLKLVGSLTGLGKTEDFKSSRFMGDKLFLVTFKQVDPFFAIDLSNPKDPEILGELKIPGYSEYLHPYDDNHIIGLGYDTTENEWGGTVRSGLKVDLYEINYDKKCGDSDLTSDEQTKCDSGDYKGIIVKQKYNLKLGDNGSYSEALTNPRMFIWNKSKKLLLLPVRLYQNDTKETYRHIDFFQGLSVININKDTGITEKGRVTHIDTTGIEEERLKECSKYVSSEDEPECKEIIGGGEYCAPVTTKYVPKYCYADSTVGEYIANKSWNYNKSFIKRALYIGDKIITISNDMLQTNNINSLEVNGSVQMK